MLSDGAHAGVLGQDCITGAAGEGASGVPEHGCASEGGSGEGLACASVRGVVAVGSGAESGIFEGLLPDGLSDAELQHRICVLYEVEQRLVESGPHVARPGAQRARQFMPFAALKGYHEMALSQENPLTESHEEVDEGL